MTSNTENQKTVITLKEIKNEVMAYLGTFDHINKLSDPKFIALLKKGMPSLLSSLIKIEIENHPEDIGGSIDILKLTSKGAEWISQKKNCK